MKINVLYNLLPDLVGKEVRIVHGTTKNNITITDLISYRKSGLNIYLKILSGKEISSRTVKSITAI